MFAASDPHGESVTLLRAIGLRYYAVVMIRGGLASSILYLLGSEVKIFTAEGFVNHVTSSREDLCSGTHTLAKRGSCGLCLPEDGSHMTTLREAPASQL